MSEQRRVSRRTTRPKPNEHNANTEQIASPPRPAPLFPIRLMDVLLYAVHVDRFPENAQLLEQTQIPAGNLNVELQAPIRIGTRMEVGVKLLAQVPSPEAPAFTVDATLNGVFEVAEDVDPELVTTFVQTTALLLIWPYAREMMQNLSLRMRVSPLVLPTLDARPMTQTERVDERETVEEQYRSHGDQEVTSE